MQEGALPKQQPQGVRGLHATFSMGFPFSPARELLATVSVSGLPPSVTEEMMIISSDHPKQTRTLEGRHCPEAASGIQPREHTNHQPPLMKTGIVQGW